MKISHTTQISGPVTAVLLALVSLASTAQVFAQTTYSFTSGAANYATGAADPNAVGAVPGKGPSSTGSSYSSGPGTSITFGQDFKVAANGTSTQSGTAAWLFDGTNNGSAITAGTQVPISFNFTIDKTIGLTSDVVWSLYFKGASNSNELIDSGTLHGPALSAASATFSGSALYDYATGASAGSTFRAYLDVSFTSNLAFSPAIINVTMLDTGLGGQGITIGASAIPEPSTYAAIAGAAMLGLAVWRRRRQSCPTMALTTNASA